MTEHILTDQRDGVLTITLHRPEKKNSFTADMYLGLNEQLQRAHKNDDVRVVVIEGNESVFSAGNDIDDFLHNPPSGPDAPVAQLLFTAADFEKPLIASVCGPAIGIGTTLLLHCDMVVAGDNAVFAVPFTSLGLSPEAGSSMLLPQLVGAHRAAEMLLLGRKVTAVEAHAWGFVNRVVDPAEATAEAHRIAQQLAALPRSSVRETKRQLKMGQRDALHHRMTEELNVFAHRLQQSAAREAFTAFNERRSPDFRSLGE